MAQARKPKHRPKKSRQKGAATPPADAVSDAARDVAALRRRARWRSLVVPGAGLWEFGLIGPGWVCYGVQLWVLLADVVPPWPCLLAPSRFGPPPLRWSLTC